ncbi:Uridylate kinase [Candidatus Methanoperedenaceae archaeon GB50]|nr:Uridylate kinase [Candidatus Methanoperedenaceae archaeon GB37]CAD7772001.1 Uridylate kinase [Candidatus Methanoperedenaceae archaeon GB50]CAD7776544.1 MAG: Uridylate kinase [Candidatus Methanoperedenaceae archaeon GB50]
MTLVISIGGSVLVGDLDHERVLAYAKVIKKLASQEKVFIVTGGGKVARKYINVARRFGASEVACDFIGIEVTRLNASLLVAAIGSLALPVYPEVPTNYREAENAASSSRVVVMGGVAPGQTTDAVSAILAEYVRAEKLLIATSVDGVYTADPRTNPNARKLSRLTPEELVEIVMKISMGAGTNSPVDPLAAKIIERCRIHTLVFDGTHPENILSAIKGEHIGTEIIP